MPEFILLCVGIVLISFFWWPWSPVAFEVPKVIFFQWFVRLMVFVFGISFLSKKKDWKIDVKLFISILIFVVWATLTSELGKNIPKSFEGNFYRNDGLITFYELIGFALLVSYFWKEKFKNIISLAFFVSSTSLSILTLIEILLHKFSLGFAATFGNPVFLAGYLVISIPFSFYLFKSTKRKIYLIGLATQILSIILIGAISSILTLIIFAVLYLIFFQKRTIKFVLITFLVGIFSLILFSWTRNYFLENSKVLIAEGRERIFQNVIRGAIKRPILGYGWANVDYAFEAGGWPMKFNNDIYVDKAHSEILETFATTGIPGLLIYIGFLGLLVKKLINKYRSSKDKIWNFTLLSTIVLYLFHSQTNVISICEEIIFWLIFGIVLFYT